MFDFLWVEYSGWLWGVGGSYGVLVGGVGQCVNYFDVIVYVIVF